MSKIPSIASLPCREKFVRRLANVKILQKIGHACAKDPVGVCAKISLLSILSKDTLACYLYVKQSLNNQKIPAEQRGFVAALDLANGIMMVGTQLLAFWTVSNDKVQKKLFDNTVGKLFSYKNNKSARHDKASSKGLQGQDKKAILKGLKDYEKVCRGGFKFLLPLVASTIIAKRIIVPFLATPAASWVKDNVLEKKAKKKKNKSHQTPNISLSAAQPIKDFNVQKIERAAKNPAELKSQFNKINTFLASA